MPRPFNILMLHVAVGVIVNSQNEILIAQRPSTKSYSGLWEFPGGKIEANETIFQALQRELLEEINIYVLAADPWLQLQYDYSEYSVVLHVWRVTQFSGEPIAQEEQLVQWAPLHHLDQFQFLAGNKEILEAINNHFS